MLTETGADRGRPPRQVQPWTRVAGHVVVRGPQRTFCSCRWSIAEENAEGAVAEHLRTAWPILVPKQHGETVREWRDRVVAAHSEALAEYELLWQQHRMGEPIQPGQAFPVIPDDWADADERIEVLEHQLAEMPSHEL